MLCDEAARLHHADQQTVLDCISLIDRIDDRSDWRERHSGQRRVQN
jgi:hypothetical protein